MMREKQGQRRPVEVRAQDAMPTPGRGQGAGHGSAPGTLRERYEATMRRVAAAAQRAGRSAQSVVVVAVSKYAEPDQVRDLIRLGHRDFGENRAMQLAQRSAQMEEFLGRTRALRGAGLPGADQPLPESVRWHMIGRLQRNKVKKVLEAARLVHSVDSLRLAEEMQAIANRSERPADILLQVNCSGEAQKGGVALPAAVHLAEQIETMTSVRLRGVMTMAALTEDKDELRRTFERCRECFEDIKTRGVGRDRSGAEGFNILSMGMSNDFEVAIEEGANMVRIGSAIFGEPSPETARRIDAEDGKEDSEREQEE